MAIQPDGRIVAIGITEKVNSAVGVAVGVAIARYNKDGSLDSSFSGDGKQTISFGNWAGDIIKLAVKIQLDGKIVATGIGNNENNGDTNSTVRIGARYHPGIYLVEVKYKNRRAQTKLIKLPH